MPRFFGADACEEHDLSDVIRQVRERPGERGVHRHRLLADRHGAFEIAVAEWCERVVEHGESLRPERVHFGAHPPARAAVQCSMVVDCKVEIECVAYKRPG